MILRKVASWLAHTFWLDCWKCDGRGYVLERGQRIPKAELTPTEYADYLVQGGPYYRAIRSACPRCGGTGRRGR